MAENEYLDLFKHRSRWQRVLKAIEDGDSSELVAPVVLDKLCQTLRALKTFLNEDLGLDLGDLISAPAEAMPQLVMKSGGQDYVRLFMTVAEAGYAGLDRTREFLTAVVDRFGDQIVHATTGEGKRFPDFREAMGYWGDIGKRIGPSVDYVARKLNENPAWKPSRPRNAAGVVGRQRDGIKSILGESLLGRSRAGT